MRETTESAPSGTAVRVAQVGDYSVSNWGDQLYPGVSAHLFEQLGISVQPSYFAPLAGRTPSGEQIRPLREVSRSDVSAVLVGGGDLIRFDNRTVAMDHMSVRHERRHSRLARLQARRFARRHFLDGPGVWAPQHAWVDGAPTVLVSVGVHTIPPSPETRKIFGGCAGAWVRTESGAAQLAGAGLPADRMVLAPDMVFALPQFASPDATRERGMALFADLIGLSEPAVIFHAATFHGWPEKRVRSALQSLAGLPVAVLSLGAYSGEDRVLARAAQQTGTPSLIGLQTDDITAVMAAAGAVFTTSMHAAIVAASFGTPVFVPGVKKTDEAFAVCPLPPRIDGVDDGDLAAAVKRHYGAQHEHDPQPNAAAATAAFAEVLSFGGVR